MLTAPKNLLAFGNPGSGKPSPDCDEDRTRRGMPLLRSIGDRLYKLLDQLSEIEGRAGNMRGILFELIAAHIAKREIGGSIDFGVLHTHRESGKQADLDVVCVTDQNAVHVIECKGKSSGGTVSLEEVTDWLGKLPIVQNYVASREHLRERNQTYDALRLDRA